MKTPTQGYLDWRANLKPGYYWVENDSIILGHPNRRILEVIHHRSGYWGARWYADGLYVISHQWPTPTEPEHFADWEGFRAEPVQPPSFT